MASRQASFLSRISQNIGVGSICFLSDPATFYGTNGFQLQEFSILDDLALSLAASVPAPLSLQFVCDAKYLYDFSGNVFDPTAGQLVGKFSLPPASFPASVLPDPMFGQTYFLTYGTPSLLVFDQKKLAQTGSIPLPANVVSPGQLLRWGTDGFAFLSGSDLILLRSDLAQPTSGPNPVPQITSVTPIVRENNGNFQLTVNGEGFVPGATVRWNGGNRTTIFRSITLLIADIPASDVQSIGSAQVTVFNPPSGGGESNALTYQIGPKELISIAVSPGNPAVLKGAPQQFTATGTFSDGSTKDLTESVVWSSANPSVATLTQGGLASTLSTGAALITATQGNTSGSTTLVVYVGDFTGAVSNGYRSLVIGESATYSVSVVSLSGFNSDVTLSVSGLPKGATATFAPPVVTGGSGSTTLTISTIASTAIGAFTLTITGSAGSLSHSTQVGLGINSSRGDFTGTIAPNPMLFCAGCDGGGPEVSLFSIGGFTGDITLTVSGLPPGFEVDPGPATVVGGSGKSGTFLLVDPDVAPGAYSFFITGASGSLVHTGKVTVDVNPLNPSDFTGVVVPQSQTTAVGGSASYTVNILPLGASPGFVQLSSSSLPPGVAPSASPSNIVPNGNGSVVITMQTSASTAPGSYTFWLTGSNGPHTHKIPLGLVVAP